jgi:hypothetical protein
VARTSKRQSDSSTLRKLKTALTEMSFNPPALSVGEGEAFICSVCQLPIKLCNADPDMHCASKLLDGTQLQLLHRSGKGRLVACLRCGGTIPKKSLEKNPLTELCPSCQRSTSKSKPSKRSKGASL